MAGLRRCSAQSFSIEDVVLLCSLEQPGHNLGQMFQLIYGQPYQSRKRNTTTLQKSERQSEALVQRTSCETQAVGISPLSLW